MASRSWSSPALVLSLSAFGEANREASVLTEDRGLIKAAVFGGPKSRLRAAAAPYHSGRMWFYSDPVKKTTKITDFDVQNWREGIRESLAKTWSASLCAEVVLRSHGSASWRLVNGFLDGINLSDESACEPALIRFLWRVIAAAGLRVDIETCARCGKVADGGMLWYIPVEDGCACEECTAQAEMTFPLSAESRFYLAAAESANMRASRALPLSAQSLSALRDFLFFLAEKMLGGKLKTVRSAAGLI